MSDRWSTLELSPGGENTRLAVANRVTQLSIRQSIDASEEIRKMAWEEGN